MPIESFRCDKTLQPVHFEHCINCADSGKAAKTFSCLHSPDVLRGIAKTIRPAMEALSVTELLECPRALWLKKKIGFSVQPSRAYWAFRGNAWHAMMELGEQPGDVIEKRMYTSIGGHPVSGQPDLIRGTTLYDWKTTKQVPKEPYEHHIVQLSCYRLIASMQDPTFLIENARIVYISMQEHVMLPVKLWSLKDTEKFMTEELSKRYAMMADKDPPAFENHFSLKNWKCGRALEYSYCEVRRECTDSQTIPEPVSKPRKVKERSQ